MCLNFLRLSYIKLALGPEVEAKWRVYPVREIPGSNLHILIDVFRIFRGFPQSCKRV